MMVTNSLIITPEMLALIAELDEFKGMWQSLGKLAPERLKALRRIATIESVGSSPMCRIALSNMWWSKTKKATT